MSAVGDARKRQTEQTADWCHPDADVRALVAEKCEQARAEGAAAALREAAASPDGEREWRNQGRSGSTPVVDVSTLYARADSLAPTTEGGEVRRDG